MPLAEGVSARIVYKPHTTGVITPGVEPVLSVDPGASGGQTIRRVSSTLTLAKDTYQSAEIRSDRQIADFRHGVRRVPGNIAGELGPLTYGDFFQACSRGTWAAAVTKTQAELTTVSADNTLSTFNFGGGNPVTEGFRVGDIIRFTLLSDVDNNDKNFVILGFSGTSNRDVAVHPAPDTMAADATFSVVNFKSLIVPSTGFVSRKFLIEIWNEDVDVAQLFSEARFGGFNIQLPPTGIATVEFDLMGRNAANVTAGSSPFFTAPTAATTTGLFASVNGLLRVSGETVAVITGLQIQMQLNATGDPVIGANIVPEIFLGRANVSGQMTAFFEDVDFLDDFRNETEIEILAYLTTTVAVNSPAMTILLPRVKLGGASLATEGEGGQTITMPFQALKYETALATDGVENTTIRISDTEQT